MICMAALRSLTQLPALRLYGWSCIATQADCQALLRHWRP